MKWRNHQDNVLHLNNEVKKSTRQCTASKQWSWEIIKTMYYIYTMKWRNHQDNALHLNNEVEKSSRQHATSKQEPQHSVFILDSTLHHFHGILDNEWEFQPCPTQPMFGCHGDA